MNTMRQRGSTLAIAMALLLIMMGLAVNMAYNAQAQSSLTSAVKLQQFYETAALNAFNKTRATLPDYWTDIDSLESNDEEWRFGKLLIDADEKDSTEEGNFPDNPYLDFTSEMNSGMLELTYKVWVRNNPDDPSQMLVGQDIDSKTVDTNWDMDGRIVLTVEVFAPNDKETPVVTQSAIVAPAGGTYIYLHDDAVLEGDASDVGGQGTGTLGSGSRIEIATLEGDGD